ncbi:membrane protein [Weizmannia acidilactici]|nr:membrane protein [Weizmannia acidilactici]
MTTNRKASNSKTGEEMVLLGTIINGLSIIAGSFIGRLLNRIPDRIKGTVMHAIGLAVMVLGLEMGLKSEQYIIVILSLVFGAVIGELLRLEEYLNALGAWLERKFGGNGQGSVAEAFITATLVFVIGAMAILGALDSGIRGDNTVLYTKSVLDGFTALILSSTLGFGVIFSAVPVVLYEGAIALFAKQINHLIPSSVLNAFITEMTATGGIMIFAIGLNIAGLAKFRVANFLPGIFVVAVFIALLHIYHTIAA